MRFDKAFFGILLLAACASRPDVTVLDESSLSVRDDIRSIGVSADGESYWVERSTEDGRCIVTSIAFTSGEVLEEEHVEICSSGNDAPEASLRIERSGNRERIIRVDVVGNQVHPITAYFEAIDSFDISPDGKEIVFSARRDGSFDVAIASLDGGVANWVFPEPVDEKLVTWAPRGNKITMVMETQDGSILRTVHVPTGASLSVNRPWAAIHQVVWEPGAERFLVLESTPGASKRVNRMRYGGEETATLVEPTPDLGLDLDRAPGMGRWSWIAAPARTRYAETYPVVVWVVDGNPLQFRAEIAETYQRTRSGMIVVRMEEARFDREFWDAVRSLSWVDEDRVFVVSEYGTGSGSQGNATLIEPSAGVAGEVRIQSRSGAPVVRIGLGGTDDLGPWAARFVIKTLGSGEDKQ